MASSQFIDIPEIGGLFNSKSASTNEPFVYKIPVTYLQNLSPNHPMIIDSCSNIVLQARNNNHVRVNNKMGIGLDPSSAYSLHVLGDTCISGNFTSRTAYINDVSVSNIDVSTNLNPLVPNKGTIGLVNRPWGNAYINDVSATNMTISGTIVPLSVTSNLGSETNRWNTIFVYDLNVTAINGLPPSSIGGGSGGGTSDISLLQVVSDIIPFFPNDNINPERKLGSVTNYWGNAYIRDISVASIDISVNLNPLVPNKGTIGLVNRAWGNAYINDISSTNMTISGNIIPLGDSSSNLGSLTKRFNKVYANDLSVNTINGQAYSAFVPSKNSINLNFPTSGLTSIKKSIIYTTPTTLTKSNISAQIDNVANIKQVYTFGQSIPNCWVAVGKGTKYTIAYSSNGITWNGVTDSSTNIFTDSGYGVAWNGTMWVALGKGTKYTIAYSSNGITWTGVQDSSTNIFTDSGYNVAYNSNRPNRIVFPSNLMVAVGRGTNSIAYSSNGINWIGIPKTNTNTFTIEGHGVAWNGNMWVAVGMGRNSIAYSSDGINWIGILNTNTNTFRYWGNGIAWNGTMWVALGNGDNSIAYSSNGITWNGIPNTNTNTFTIEGHDVAWNGTMWVAVGQGTNSIAYSYDGISWTGIPNTNTNTFSETGFGVAWNGNIWVAVGQGDNSIAYSSDGITWIGIPNTNTNTFTDWGFGVAWNGTLWVAVGSGTNSIAYSYDGINWTGVQDSSTNIFTFYGNSVTWNGTLWVAVGEGTNSIAYSYDGITWTGIPKTNTNTFTNFGQGVAWNAGIGDVSMNPITLNKYGLGLSNKLDIVADKYYNTGYSNLTLTIES